MSEKPINEVLADNLSDLMKVRGLTQTEIGNRTGMGQSTVSLYLHPDRRKISKSGKIPSAKLSEVDALAKALSVEIWQLLRPLNSEQRAAYEAIEAAFKALQPKTTPPPPSLVSTQKQPRSANGV